MITTEITNIVVYEKTKQLDNIVIKSKPNRELII